MKKEQLTELILKVQKGDSDAANAFFSVIYNDVYYFALKTVKDSHLAEDITQEALIAIFNNIHSLNDPVAFPAWSRQVTYSQCTRYFRKTKETLLDENEDGSNAFDILEEDKTEFIPHEALDQKDLQKIILSFIDTLSPDHRTTVMLYYFDELSISKIAEIQDITESAVKSRLYFARQAIKAKVEEYEKKTGIRLHAIPFLPFIKWIFFTEKSSVSASPAAIKAASSAALSTTAASSAAAVSSTSVGTAIGTVVAKITGASLVTKIIAGVVALTFVIGIPIAFLVNKKDNRIVSVTITPPNTVTTNEAFPYEETEDSQPVVHIEKVVDNVTYVRRIPGYEDSHISYITADGQDLYELNSDKTTYWLACQGPQGTEPKPDVLSITIPAEIDGIPVLGMFGNFSTVFPNLEELIVRCQYGETSHINNERAYSDTLKRLVIGKEVLYFPQYYSNYPNLEDIVIERNDQRNWGDFGTFSFFNTAFFENEENWITDGDSRFLICSDILIYAKLGWGDCHIPEGVYAANNCLYEYHVDSVLHFPSTFINGIEFVVTENNKQYMQGNEMAMIETIISPDNPVYYVENGVIKTKADGKPVEPDEFVF